MTAQNIVGVLVFLIGAGLAAGPWWSSTLPAEDYPLVWVLGAIFGGIGMYTAIPDGRLPRLRSFTLAVFMAGFGLMCLALAFAPWQAGADGRYLIGGLYVTKGAVVPLWARIIAGFFALLCLAVASVGVWGLVRGLFDRER